MADEQNNDVFVPTPPVVPFHLRLASLKSTRQTCARVIREYWRGNVDPTTYRNTLYGFTVLLSIAKAEKELDIDERLTDLEAAIREGGNGKV